MDENLFTLFKRYYTTELYIKKIFQFNILLIGNNLIDKIPMIYFTRILPELKNGVQMAAYAANLDTCPNYDWFILYNKCTVAGW